MNDPCVLKRTILVRKAVLIYCCLLLCGLILPVPSVVSQWCCFSSTHNTWEHKNHFYGIKCTVSYFLFAVGWSIEVPLSIWKGPQTKTMCTWNKNGSISETAKASRITSFQKFKFGITILIPGKMDIRKLGMTLIMPYRMKCWAVVWLKDGHRNLNKARVALIQF